MRHKPWTDGAGAYDELDTLAEVDEVYRRCRAIQHYIVRQVNGLRCQTCRARLTAPANRCTYNPRTGRVTVQCYECAMTGELAAVYAAAEEVPR